MGVDDWFSCSVDSKCGSLAGCLRMKPNRKNGQEYSLCSVRPSYVFILLFLYLPVIILQGIASFSSYNLAYYYADTPINEPTMIRNCLVLSPQMATDDYDDDWAMEKMNFDAISINAGGAGRGGGVVTFLQNYYCNGWNDDDDDSPHDDEGNNACQDPSSQESFIVINTLPLADARDAICDCPQFSDDYDANDMTQQLACASWDHLTKRFGGVTGCSIASFAMSLATFVIAIITAFGYTPKSYLWANLLCQIATVIIMCVSWMAYAGMVMSYHPPSEDHDDYFPHDDEIDGEDRGYSAFREDLLLQKGGALYFNIAACIYALVLMLVIKCTSKLLDPPVSEQDVMGAEMQTPASLSSSAGSPQQQQYGQYSPNGHPHQRTTSSSVPTAAAAVMVPASNAATTTHQPQVMMLPPNPQPTPLAVPPSYHSVMEGKPSAGVTITHHHHAVASAPVIPVAVVYVPVAVPSAGAGGGHVHAEAHHLPPPPAYASMPPPPSYMSATGQ